VECRSIAVKAGNHCIWSVSVLLLTSGVLHTATHASPQDYTIQNQTLHFANITPASAPSASYFLPDCELEVLSLLGWQQAYDPKGYTISANWPSNCSLNTWQSLGCLKLLTNLTLTGSLPNLPDSWAANGAFVALRALNLSSTTLTGSLPSSWAHPRHFQGFRS